MWTTTNNCDGWPRPQNKIQPKAILSFSITEKLWQTGFVFARWCHKTNCLTNSQILAKLQVFNINGIVGSETSGFIACWCWIPGLNFIICQFSAKQIVERPSTAALHNEWTRKYVFWRQAWCSSWLIYARTSASCLVTCVAYNTCGDDRLENSQNCPFAGFTGSCGVTTTTEIELRENDSAMHWGAHRTSTTWQVALEMTQKTFKMLLNSLKSLDRPSAFIYSSFKWHVPAPPPSYCIGPSYCEISYLFATLTDDCKGDKSSPSFQSEKGKHQQPACACHLSCRAIATCMFLGAAVKSIVKPITNHSSSPKAVLDSPRLTADFGQTVIGLVWKCDTADVFHWWK